MALQIMAPGTGIATELGLVGTLAREMGHRLGAALAERAPGIFDPYRPELHYMRGPGPKWREKHDLAAREKHALLPCRQRAQPTASAEAC
jgi:hypothetical protein